MAIKTSNYSLSGDDIAIQTHKLACLEITCLLSYKNMLYVGTTSGVVVTVELPDRSAFLDKTLYLRGECLAHQLNYCKI